MQEKIFDKFLWGNENSPEFYEIYKIWSFYFMKLILRRVHVPFNF